MTQDRDAAGYTRGQIRGLKIAIAMMTALIFIGLVVIVLTIAYRSAHDKRRVAAEPEYGTPPNIRTLYPGATAFAEAKLPPGGHVVSITPWGEKLLLLVEDVSGSTVLVLDPKANTVALLARLQTER